jgi:hypothetical protein
VARTFTDLQSEALGSDFAAGTFPGTRVGQFLNDAVHRVARRVHLPKLEKTQTITSVAGTSSYAQATDEIRLLSLSNTTDREALPQVDIDDIDDSPAASGEPEVFALSDGQYVFYPTPDKAYSFQARYLNDTVFATGGDTTDSVGFPDDYADMLVTWARSRMFRFEDDLDAADRLRAEFDVEIANLKSDMHRQSPRRVRRVGGWRYAPARPPFQIPS